MSQVIQPGQQPGSGMRRQSMGVLRFFRLMSRNKVGFAGFLVVIGFLFMVLVGPKLVPLDVKSHVDRIYQPPSHEHWLGTDHQGRDIFAQMVHGGRDIIFVAALTAVISTGIAVALGGLSAFLGGRVDALILGLADVVLTIPQFPLLAVLAGFIRLSSATSIALILGLLDWPVLLRAVRAQVLSVRERDFVQAAQSLGMGTGHIVFREILPNMLSYITIAFILGMTGAMYAQVALILLGLVPMASNNWGVMIYLAWVRGAIFFKNSLLYILAPISAIALFQLALVSTARSLEEVFNPRLRAGD